MRREILMPPVTPSMVDGKISRWHVAEGQSVAVGDVLVEIATSTATLEIEAQDEGHVERILVPAGTEGVKVNTPIAIVLPVERTRASVRPLAFAALEPVVTPVCARNEPRPSEYAPREARTYREALRDALAEEMRADERVFFIGVDVAQNRGAQKVGQGLLDEFGSSRVVTAPAMDEALFGLVVGAAMGGLKPVVEIGSWGRALDVMMPYLAEATETFYLSGGKAPLSIVFRGPNGFSPGVTGQEARCVAGVLAQIPGLAVVQPASASTADRLLSTAIRSGLPVAVLEHELLYASREPHAASGADSHVDLGVARVARAGADVTIAASGRAVVTALDAAEKLSDEGIEVEIIDLMSVRPLDVDTVAGSVARTGRLVTVEEGWGIGAALASSVVTRCFGVLRAAPVEVAGARTPMPYAASLQASAVPDSEALVSAVHATLRRA